MLVGTLKGFGNSRRASPVHQVIPHLVTKGSGWFRSSAGTFELQTGDLFCLFPEVLHEFGEHQKDPWEFFWMPIGGPGASDLATTMGVGPDAPVRSLDPSAPVIHAFDILFQYWGRPNRIAHEGVALLHEFLAAMSPRYEPSVSADLSSVNLVADARILVESLLETGLNVSELADRLGISRGTLWRSVRQQTGQTPVAWLKQMRIERAKQILARSSRKLSAVASMCGFNDVKYFMRCFREVTGVTPGEWKKIFSRKQT
jgi:AraC-like DNA-binding protein